MSAFAFVKLIETVGGRYGYHEKTGEVNQFDVSDIPTWEFWPAYAVQIIVFGAIEWGPYKIRANAKKEHRGRAKVKLTVTEFFDQQNCRGTESAYKEAIWRATEISRFLETKGIFVRTVEFHGGRYENPHDEMKNPLVRRSVEFYSDQNPPARFQKRIAEMVFLETLLPEE